MTESKKPLPDLDDPRTAAFWRATRQGKLVVQQCLDCGYLRWPPGPLCPECLTEGGEWTEIRPTGTLWSVAVYHRALDAAFSDEIPYAVGLVELDDGPRMYGTMVGDPDSFVLDTPVRAVFFDATPEVTFVRWEAAGTLYRGLEEVHHA